MKKSLAAAAILVSLAGGAKSALAETFFLGTEMRSAMCVDVRGGGSDLILWNCHGGSNQQVSFNGYGPLMMNGRCVDTQGEGKSLVVQSCDPKKKSQKWAFKGGQINNEEGWCMDAKGQASQSGTPIIAWKCNGGTNQKFRKGFLKPQASLPSDVQQKVADMNKRIGQGGGNVVAMGGANVVAMGGANVIAVGGGNVVAMGGGN